MKNRAFSIFLILAMLCTLFPQVALPASAEVLSGTCGAEGDGSNLTWTLDNETGVLSISGSGTMQDYMFENHSPWYNNRSAIKNIAISNSVTSLGNYAFHNCTSLTGISIPDNVIRIGNNAFYGCSSLQDILLPDKLTNIEDRTFYRCSSLKNVTLPENVTSIGEEAFDRCNSLTDIVFPARLTSIGYSAFSNCGALQHLTIKGDVKKVGDSAFYNCYALNSVVFAEGVTAICNSMFSRCSSLKSLTIPNSVTSIGDYSFYGCTSLTTVIIPKNVSSIGKSSFGGCSSLTAVTVAADNTNYCDLDGVLFSKDQTTLLLFPEGRKGSYSIPNSVTSIADFAFESCIYLEHISIPNSVLSIGNQAFSYCTSLTSITIPDSINSISYGTFYGCESLLSVTIPNSVASIEDSAFYACSALTSITIPDSVKSIGNSAFLGCDSLTSVSLGNGQTSISDQVFRDCYSLTSILIPDCVESIGKSAFEDCSSLTSLTIGSGLKIVDEKAFNGCKSLSKVNVTSLSNWCTITFCDNETSNPLYYAHNLYVNNELQSKLTIPDDVKNINRYTFNNCTSLTELTIPGSVNSVGYGAFMLCTNLHKLTLGSGLASIEGWAFSYCSALSSVKIPGSVKNVDSYAFYECNSLTKAEIENGTETIGRDAFYDCTALAQVILPESLTIIESGAFSNTAFSNDESNWSDDLLYCGCWLIDAKASVQDAVIKLGTTGIANDAFSWCEALTNVAFPESLTSIGAGAFYGCALTNAVIPRGVIRIGEQAFCYCPSLTSFSVSTSNPVFSSLDGVIFNKDQTELCLYPYGKEGEYIIPDGVTSIGKQAFYGCDALTGVTISDTVTEIAESAFKYCDALPNVTIPESVNTIGDSAFSTCRSLQSVTISGGVKTIGKAAFYACNSLSNVSLENGITSIEAISFYACESLKSVIIPYSVTSIGYNAFGWSANDYGSDIKTGITIYGYNNTAAQVYSEENDVSFISLGDAPVNPCTEGHTPGEAVQENETPPTCTEKGGYDSVIYCMVCGEEISREHVEVDALGHDFDAWKVTKAPTCIEPGSESRTCSRCGQTENRVLEALGHTPAEAIKENETAVTCTENGGYDTVVYCAACGIELFREHTDIPALGHNWSEGVVTVEPTEEADGEMTFTCTRCGETRTEVIPKNDHEHDYQPVVTAPTCTEQGYTTYTCSKCGASYVANYVPANGHSFVDGVCTVCGAKDPDYKPDDPQPENPFEDVADDDWFNNAVLWATSQNPAITNGTDATHFSPSNKCTRAEIVQFLWNAAGKPAVEADKSVISSEARNPFLTTETGDADFSTQASRNDMRGTANPFVDVSEDDWYYNAVMWAVANGITNGTDATHFAPSKKCTRAEVVMFLWNAAGTPEIAEGTNNPFNDVAADAWYKGAVLWAVAEGITSGTTPTTFAPTKVCTRAEVVQFLYKAS